MKFNFNINPDVPLHEVKTPSQVDANTLIALLSTDRYILTLEVRGDIQLPRTGGSLETGRQRNKKYNWYEVFIEDAAREDITESMVVSLDAPTPDAIFNCLWTVYQEIQEDKPHGTV